MDINTKTLQHQAVAITPLRPDNVKKPVDSLVKSAADAAQKTEVQSVSADIAVADKAKDAEESGDLKQAVSQLNDFVQSMQRNLQFSIDKESGAMVVKVIDAKSEKIIRQMPSEETLRLARSLAEQSDDVAFNIFNSRA
ncbi:MAG: flagellar protein FlaG [Methylobacter sp.]|uniref:flagellar protein FlaG n=1 Tax=Methylobacter sp. TaxID=2051955 RepID=UPI0025E418DE|nr:flagellar protein FlaG [Methylobacter sp.]MCK9623020.1 flagellar protein FlaG [Methylobacter sp.]